MNFPVPLHEAELLNSSVSQHTTRFAPSPTGFLHLGHVLSACFAARAAGLDGRFLLRIEDIDTTRCRPEYTAAIFDDLAFLGLRWCEPVLHQSTQMDFYQPYLERLRERGLLYPCFCTRKDIATQIAAAAGAPQGTEGAFVYTGTCRALSADEQMTRLARGEDAAWRLDMAKACALCGDLTFTDREHGDVTAHPRRFGDVVLARKDIAASYHLCVVVDDARQGVTLVTRGEDLFPATDIHVLLQRLLDLPTPLYHHHALLLDAGGQRLAKREGARAVREYRRQGLGRGEILALAGVPMIG